MTGSDHARTDPPDEVVLGDSRSRVMAVLQSAREPLGVGEIADAIGLHPNTTRFHLDALLASGLIERTSEERDTPGRPRSLYSATPTGLGAGTRSYRMLAEILVNYLAAQTDRPREAAVTAGEAWGRALVQRDGGASVDPEEATAELVRTLAAMGFAPETVDAGGERQVIAHHCPFREVAHEHSDVVCGIHLGIVRGVLAQMNAPVRAEHLEPLVGPSMCITHLSAPG